MSITATGLELRQFYKEWPPGTNWYVEEGQFDDELGNWLLDDAATYDVAKLGSLGWQGDWHGSPKDGRLYTLEYWFARWKGTKTTTPMAVVVPDEEVGAFRELCDAHGWRIL